VKLKLTSAAGAVIWLSALTAAMWAGHKPPLVLAGAALVLTVIGVVLFNWPDRQ
jgi:hypothetical protein